MQEAPRLAQLGHVFLKMGKYSEAVLHHCCVHQEPALSRQVTTAGDSMGAIRSYVKALTLQPNQQSTWDSLAIACTATGDFGLADSADHHDLAAFRRHFVS